MKNIKFIFSCFILFSVTAVSWNYLHGRVKNDPKSNYREFTGIAFTVLLKQYPHLEQFYRKLADKEAKGEKEIVKYMLYEYSIIVPGEKGKMMHHHGFLL